jgi:maleylacetate reductase
VALGGGAAIGIGKAVVVQSQMPLIAMPTTYSGSEMTALYGVTRGTRKDVIHDPLALPRTVLYDPALTDTLQRKETFASLMNCLAHCLECSWEDPGNSYLLELALAGVSHISTGAALVDTPETVSLGRDHLLAAGMYGGLVLGAGRVGIHHTLCHIIGGYTRGSHGEINGIVLPKVMKATAPQTHEVQELLIEPLRRLVGSSTAPPYSIVEQLGDRWGLPRNLSGFRRRTADVSTLVGEMYQAQQARKPYVSLSETEMAAVTMAVTRASEGAQ